MPVRELQERITSAEFTELCAYLSVEPHGYEIENWRAGVIAATIANVHSGKKLKPQDFYPNRKRNRIRLSPRQEKQLKEKQHRDRQRKNG